MAGITHPNRALPDTVSKPNELMSGHFFTERTPQAQVVLNADTRSEETYLKQRNTQVLPHSQLIDAYTGNTEDVNFHSGDVAIMYRGDVTTPRDAKTPGERKPRVFASFTGEKIPQGFTQEQFDMQFVVVGFAKTAFEFNSLDQPQNGIAVRVGGAGTTKNNGSKTFRPLDWIKVRIPSIDPDQRRKDDLNRPANKGGSPATKQTPILEPYTMNDMFAWVEEAVDWYFSATPDQGNFSRIYADRMFNGKTNTGPMQEVSLGFARWAVHNAISSVALLENMNLISFNRPLLKKLMEHPDAYNNYVTAFEDTYNLERLSRMKWDDTNSKFTDFSSENEMTEEYGARSQCLGAIAAVFGGLLPDKQRTHLKYSKHAVDAVVMRTYYSILKDPALIQRGTVMHYLGGNILNRRMRNNLKRLGLDNNISKSISTLEKGAYNDFMLSMCQARLLAESKIVGRALTQSAPKEQLDYVIY